MSIGAFSSVSKEKPPMDLSTCVAIVCNGQPEESLGARIKSCSRVIGVDGGINLCAKLNISLDWMVGDFDSIDPDLLKRINNEAIQKLQRAKDVTDLEVGIAKAREIAPGSDVVIFAGLGKRIDHTLGNIFLLLREPGVTFLESENNILFAVNSSSGEIKITPGEYRTLTLYPLHGKAENIIIETEDSITVFDILDQAYTCSFSQGCSLQLRKGELIVSLDKRQIAALPPLSRNEVEVDFSLNTPISHIFNYLDYQCSRYKEVSLFSNQERLTIIKPESGKVSFKSQVGQTISLIPLHGPATGITTEGLKWELGDSTLSRLDKNFVGISNVSMKDEFSVEIKQGTLLCVVNINLIDQEMVGVDLSKKTP